MAGFKIADGYLEVTADHSKADRALDGFFRDVNGRLHDQRGRFIKEGDIAGEEYADRLTKAADRKSSQSFGGLAQRFGKRFLTMGGMAGKLFANGFVLKAVGGLAALPTAISLTGALAQGLAQIGGSIAALAPAAIAGAAFSLITLKLALSGFGNAFKAGLSGDVEKFNEALKKLAPAAQAAVKEFVALAPAARELKKVVQNSFFAPWVDDIKPLALQYLPILRKEMAYLAGSAGMAVSGIAQVFAVPATATQFQAMLHSFGDTFSHIAAGIPGIVSGFLSLAAGGSSWLSRLTEGFSDLTQRFAAWSATFVGSGSFDAFVSRGLSLIGDLAKALTNIGGILRSVFAAVPGGGGLFAALGQLTGALNAFLQTAQGQQVLVNFFARLQTIAGLIMDVVKGALPGLLALSDGLLQGLQALAPVAGPVGKALGEVFGALAPVLPLLGNLLGPILQVAATLLRALAAELGPVIKLFSDMASQVLPMLLPMLDEFASQVLPIAADAGRQIAEAFAPIVPVWIEMARIVGGELMKYLPAFLDVSKAMIPTFVQVGKILADTWLVAFEQIRPHIPFLIQLFAALVLTAAQLLSWYIKLLPIVLTLFSWFIKAAAWVMGFVLSIRHLPGAIADAAAAFWGWIKGVGSAIGGFFVQVGQWFAELPGKIWGFVQQIPTIISNALSAAFDAFFFWLGFITQTVINFVMNLPTMISNMWETIKTTFMNAVAAVGQFLSELPLKAALFFIELYNTVTTWVSNTYNSVTDWLGKLPGRVGGFFSDLWERAKSTTISGVNSVISTVKGLPGMVLDALKGAGKWLEGVGSDIVHGLINGFNSALDWARDMVGKAMNKIKEGAKAALHIGSPSRVFADEVGRHIPTGIAMGIQRGMPELERMLHVRMAGLTGAARGPQVNVAAPNVAVGGTTVTLLVDGEEIAAKIITPGRVDRANREGARRRGFLDTGRAATA